MLRTGLTLPLLDEDRLVDAVTRRILSVADAAGMDIVLCLVDNGSQDGTRARIQTLEGSDDRIRGVYLDENAGYGGGILAGMRHLVGIADLDIVGWAWGDGQVDPSVLPTLVRACTDGAMMAKARRVERRDGRRRRFVSQAYAAVTRGLGVRTPDVNGCPKLLRREAWLTLSPRSRDWFLDPEVILGAEERGWRIADAPVVMQPRMAGRSKVDWRTAAEFGWNLARWQRGWRP